MAKIMPAFSGIKTDESIILEEANTASYKGIGIKTFILLLVAVASAIIFPIFLVNNPDMGIYLLFVFMFGAIILGIIGQMSPGASSICGVLYSVCEGAMLGLLSLVFEAYIPGVIFMAVLVTFSMFGIMLLLYMTNIIKVTNGFLRFVAAFLTTSFIAFLVGWIITLVSPNSGLAMTLTQSPLTIILTCVFVMIYGGIMLTLDFNHADTLVKNGFDKKYEWTAALGFMITLIWIYVEALRIIVLLSNRRK